MNEFEYNETVMVDSYIINDNEHRHISALFIRYTKDDKALIQLNGCLVTVKVSKLSKERRYD